MCGKAKWTRLLIDNFLKIEIMKKIVTVILCYLISMTVSAQTVVKRPRSNNVTPKEHLSFEGLPIDGTEVDMWKKLEKKGFKTKLKDSNNVFSRYAEGKVGNVDCWQLTLYTDDALGEDIYGIHLYREYATGTGVLGCFWKMKQYIETKYNVTNKVSYIGENSLNDEETEIHYMIAGKGRIELSYGKGKYGDMGIWVIFLDKENESQLAIRPVSDVYDLKSDKYGQCIIDVSSAEIKFYIEENSNIYKFLSRNKDKEQIKHLIEGNYDNQIKTALIGMYIVKGIELCKEGSYIPILTTEYNSICEAYLAKVNAQKVQEKSQPANVKVMLVEELYKRLFSPYERKIMPLEVLELMKSAALRKSSGGNNDEGSHTQWDLYNDAQKAVIHEHDNAK